MADSFNDKVRKLDESFGTYSNGSNQNTEATVTEMSEDDKQHPMADDLGLDFKHPSTNDAPEQKVPHEVTPEQRIESDQIQARDRIDQAHEILDQLKDSAETLKAHAEAKIEDTVQAETKEVKKAENECKLHIDELKTEIANDPMQAIKEIGKVLLMIIGACTVLKIIFGRH